MFDFSSTSPVHPSTQTTTIRVMHHSLILCRFLHHHHPLPHVLPGRGGGAHTHGVPGDVGPLVRAGECVCAGARASSG